MFDNERYNQFAEEMEDAGFEVDYDYHGRADYVGPAVRVERSDEQAVIRASTMHLRVDSMGLGLIMYPG
jgi:hypothetical protein